MSQINDKNMKWILFWAFLILFVLSVLGTLGVVFFGFGTPTDSERELLVKGLIGEIALCVVALFYSIFGLKRDSGVASDSRFEALEQRMLDLETKLSEIKQETPEVSELMEGEVTNLSSPLPLVTEVDIYPSKTAIENYSKPPPFDTNTYALTPSMSKIREDINGAKPYERENKRSNYVGLKIQWKCAFHSLSEIKDGFRVSVTADVPLGTVDFILDKTSDVSKLKIMDENEPMWIRGEIEKVSALGAELTGVNFSV